MLYREEFNAQGIKTICEIQGLNKDMLMDVRIHNMRAGQSFTAGGENKETALLLLAGGAELRWNGNTTRVSRSNVFDDGPFALHLPAGCNAEVVALADSEILEQATENAAGRFEAKLYTPQDCKREPMGETQWGGTAERLVLTVFDYANAPWSNMVLGEVIHMQGRWSSYPPHSHPQPEVYYHKFDRPQGFGVSLIGDDAYQVHDGDASCIPGGLYHPQVTAPGYRMYFCWMIRHLPDNPWTSRDIDPEHAWLLG